VTSSSCSTPTAAPTPARSRCTSTRCCAARTSPRAPASPAAGQQRHHPPAGLGQPLLNRTANVLFGTGYTDLCYGYNAFWTSCLPALELDADGHAQDRKLWGDGFEIETIINTRIAKANLRIVEVPSYEFDRIHGTSNLNTWRDGTRVLRALLVERLNRKGRAHQTTARHTLADVTPTTVRTARTAAARLTRRLRSIRTRQQRRAHETRRGWRVGY
jgi:hypothetical protein